MYDKAFDLKHNVLKPLVLQQQKDAWWKSTLVEELIVLCVVLIKSTIYFFDSIYVKLFDIWLCGSDVENISSSEGEEL